MILKSFRLNWMKRHLPSKKYSRKVRAELKSGFAFFSGIVIHGVSNRRSRLTSLDTLGGQKIYIDSFMGFYIFDEIYIQKIYERDIRPANILDIGANIGLFTLWAYQRWAPTKMISVEPEPRNFEVLKKNVKQNMLRGVELVNAAVTPDGEPVKLYIHQSNTGGHSTVRTSKDSIVSRGVSIAELIEKFDGDAVDLMKIDCEGAEYDIIKQIIPIRTAQNP